MQYIFFIKKRIFTFIKWPCDSLHVSSDWFTDWDKFIKMPVPSLPWLTSPKLEAVMKYSLLSQVVLQESHLSITVLYKSEADLAIAFSNPAYLMSLYLQPVRKWVWVTCPTWCCPVHDDFMTWNAFRGNQSIPINNKWCGVIFSLLLV